MGPTLGGTPTYFKRKRGIYRALKRGDMNVTVRYNFELMLMDGERHFQKIFYQNSERMPPEDTL